MEKEIQRLKRYLGSRMGRIWILPVRPLTPKAIIFKVWFLDLREGRG